MGKDLVIPKNIDSQVGELMDLVKKAKEYSQFARSFNTNRAYASDWRDFSFWCKSNGLNPLPATPQTVIAYLVSRASNNWINEKGGDQKPLKVSSLRRRLTSISQAHILAKIPFDKSNGDLQEVWKGIRNKLGIAQTHKLPILINDLRKMLSTLHSDGGNHLINIRDRALLLLGFTGAFRRSELVSLNIRDIAFIKEGLIVTLRRSKTDQEGEGRVIPIPYGSNMLTCPIRNLQDWIKVSGIIEGPIFRPINRHGQIQDKRLSSHAVALIIKRNEYLSEDFESYSGHSLRAGFATTAAIAGVPEHLIMKQTGHKRTDTIKRYIRLGNLWSENAASKIGL